MILDLFAGPGGWDEGLRRLNRTDVLGIEWDAAACTTARNAGHQRLHADVSVVDPHQFSDVQGIIASPPCQGFSRSGLKAGLDDEPLIRDLLEEIATGHDNRADYSTVWHDPRSSLMVEPMRYLLATGATWLAMEQVPAVQPLWDDYAAHFRNWGWSVEVAILNAQDYGVPQHRKRAVLVASRDTIAVLPKPTVGTPVPASTVLGPGVVGFARKNDRDDGGKYRARDMRSTDLPAFTVTEKVRSWTLIPTGGEPRQLTIPEASQLQSFPPDYPWHGRRTNQCLQIANAVPPAMAAAIAYQVL